MSKKVFNFNVPVSGFESFSVIADSYEEALEKIENSDYYCAPSLDDIDWDFGFRDVSEELPKCYSVSKYNEGSQ